MIARVVAPESFLAAASAARATLPHADALSPLPDAHNLDGARCYLSEDGRSGFLVTADGDAQQLFSTARGRGDALVCEAIKAGARTLDCFDGYLSALYARHGFVVVRREPNWTPGGPDVVYMALRLCASGAHTLDACPQDRP